MFLGTVLTWMRVVDVLNGKMYSSFSLVKFDRHTSISARVAFSL